MPFNFVAHTFAHFLTICSLYTTIITILREDIKTLSTVYLEFFSII